MQSSKTPLVLVGTGILSIVLAAALWVITIRRNEDELEELRAKVMVLLHAFNQDTGSAGEQWQVDDDKSRNRKGSP